jgi:hypothetical protein
MGPRAAPPPSLVRPEVRGSRQRTEPGSRIAGTVRPDPWRPGSRQPRAPPRIRGTPARMMLQLQLGACPVSAPCGQAESPHVPSSPDTPNSFSPRCFGVKPPLPSRLPHRRDNSTGPAGHRRPSRMRLSSPRRAWIPQVIIQVALPCRQGLPTSGLAASRGETLPRLVIRTTRANLRTMFRLAARPNCNAAERRSPFSREAEAPSEQPAPRRCSDGASADRVRCLVSAVWSSRDRVPILAVASASSGRATE